MDQLRKKNLKKIFTDFDRVGERLTRALDEFLRFLVALADIKRRIAIAVVIHVERADVAVDNVACLQRTIIWYAVTEFKKSIEKQYNISQLNTLYIHI